MNRLEKIGYFLIGIGVGIFGSTMLYQRELDKPIGDIEDYIDDADYEDVSEDDEDEDVAEFVPKNILDAYSYNQTDELEIRAQRRRDDRSNSTNTRTRYSRMYDDGKKAMNDILEKARLKQAQSDPDYENHVTDSPNDDEPSPSDFGGTDILDDDVVTERVEGNFEIYLAGEPRDFVTLIFYKGDNTLTDDRDGVIPSANDVVGRAAIDRLLDGGPGAENHTIFVKNLRTNITYEVVLDAGSYSETVLGIFESRRNKGATGDVSRR